MNSSYEPTKAAGHCPRGNECPGRAKRSVKQPQHRAGRSGRTRTWWIADYLALVLCDLSACLSLAIASAGTSIRSDKRFRSSELAGVPALVPGLLSARQTGTANRPILGQPRTGLRYSFAGPPASNVAKQGSDD